jgi:amidase
VTELLTDSAAQIVGLIQAREISSREVTRLMLERIEDLNPGLNAVIELRAEQALAEAAAADEAMVHGSRRPLPGVPMTVKEALNVAGLHTTWGNPAFRDYVAQTDATVVRRLKDAGAIIVGKTNAAFMLADFAQTANDLYGRTNNPWDTALTPGGSSGGSAAAVAAGMTFLEYGSDLVGSIRIPASFCGVYGLKPSAGIVPLTGFQVPGPPAGPSEMSYMSALGPLARSAADLRLALRTTAGPEAPARNAYRWRLAPPRHTQLREFRVGVVLDDKHAPVSSEVASVLSDAVDALSRAGAKVVAGWPEGIDPARQAESFAYHIDLFFAFVQPGSEFPKISAFISEENTRMSSRAAWARYFDDVDVFFCPANFTPAFPHDDRPFESRTVQTPEGERPYTSQPFWISHASLPGLPAVAAPVGRTRSGLPVGAQIIGPLFEDDTPIAFSELLAAATGGYAPPDL